MSAEDPTKPSTPKLGEKIDQPLTPPAGEGSEREELMQVPTPAERIEELKTRLVNMHEDGRVSNTSLAEIATPEAVEAILAARTIDVMTGMVGGRVYVKQTPQTIQGFYKSVDSEHPGTRVRLDYHIEGKVFKPGSEGHGRPLRRNSWRVEFTLDTNGNLVGEPKNVNIDRYGERLTRNYLEEL